MDITLAGRVVYIPYTFVPSEVHKLATAVMIVAKTIEGDENPEVLAQWIGGAPGAWVDYWLYADGGDWENPGFIFLRKTRDEGTDWYYCIPDTGEQISLNELGLYGWDDKLHFDAVAKAGEVLRSLADEEWKLLQLPERI